MQSINNLDTFLQTIAAGQTCIGCCISLSDPAVSELMAEVGFDFSWIDLEHAPLSLESALAHVLAVRGTRTAPFIRVAWNDPVILKPVLELAPAGVIVPLVRTPEEAARAVAACKYPPAGIRGYGPRRGVHYGAIAPVDYVKDADAKTLVIVQLEHIDVMKHLEELIATPGLDGVCIGPNDLSGSMGKLAQVDDPEVRAAIVQILKTARRFGKLAGVAGNYDPDRARFWLDSGAQWLLLTVDWVGMAIHGRGIIAGVRKVEGRDSA